MAFYPPAPEPGPNRTALVLTVSVLAALLVLLGIGLMWMLVGRVSLLGTRPTPTPTAGPTFTPTIDVRATHVAEDMLTQIAFAATMVGKLTPGSPGSVALAPGAGTPPPSPGVQVPLVMVPGATQTMSAGGATSATVFLPSAARAETPTFTPGPPQPPGPVPPGPAGPPAPEPGASPTPIPAAVTPTPVLPPTPIPLPPSPTPTYPAVATLNAAMRGVDTAARVGPSNIYTITGNIGASTGVQLRGRTPDGDWVVACCFNNNEFWVRRAFVTISGNISPTGALSDTDPNDPRWLPIRPIDPSLNPPPSPTAIPPDDFPLARYDNHNSGRVPVIPNPPLQQIWGNLGQAGQQFVSPVAITGQNVVASSMDNQVYSINRESGAQLWRYDLRGNTNLAPAIQDGIIYLAFSGNQAVALQPQGNNAGLIWQTTLPGNAVTPFTVYSNTVFIGTGEGAEASLVAVNRNRPDEKRRFDNPDSRVQLPAIGGETVFVGANQLWALDANFFYGLEIIWTSGDVFNVAAPPLYASPGVVKLSELYVVDSNGQLWALDAATGQRIWVTNVGGGPYSLAINESSVFVTAGGVVRAVARQNGGLQWSMGINGIAVGGPFATSSRVLVVTQTGTIHLFDALTGGQIIAQTSMPAVSAGPAVSQLSLYVPTGNNVFAFRGAP